MPWTITTTTILIFTLLLPLLRTLSSFLRNLNLARKIKLPYTVFPIYEANLLYISLFESRWFRHIINTYVPGYLRDYIYNGSFRGRWAVKDRLKRRHGGVYLSVSPGGISCHVADADVVSQVTYPDCLVLPYVGTGMVAFEMYGRSVFTSEGSQWSYHHRYTAPAFNEKNNALVWREGVRQAKEMAEFWEKKHSKSTTQSKSFILPDPREDILKLSLNIICSAGFGVKLPFRPSPSQNATAVDGAEVELFKDVTAPSQGYTFTFRGVMEYMNRSMTSVFIANGILPRWIPRILLPFFKKDFAAHEDLGKYLHALVRKAEQDEDNETHNLLGRLVAARRDEQKITNGRNPGLSDAEILGNVYIFSIAGHETTATTLRFALVLLALHQHVQDDLYAEIETVLREEDSDNPDEWDYATIFPKLVTPLCIMLETLRLYPPVTSIPKLTANPGADIIYDNKTYHLPPNVRVNLDANALHYSEEYWGPDAATFEPIRWDKRNKSSFLAKNDGLDGLAGPGLESPDTHKPTRGAFIPFSDGLRACMGRKFAQVEFVAALVAVFREYRVTLAKREGESDEVAKRRGERALRESSASLTLALGDEVPLMFQRRAGSA
ncbi:hypothetical protein IFM61606_09508 [Aspergillus udagawae]|nr:hypothetical protein IFM61606_09508 [Aspergillus udagawae]GFG18956.1 hypothetical protein IFM5058_09547 [Aspergillus udagawae]